MGLYLLSRLQLKIAKGATICYSMPEFSVSNFPLQSEIKFFPEQFSHTKSQKKYIMLL